jgi:hypothetical protein
VKHIEVRPAHCELEALLVEADLVGKLRPGFNRQMRSWRRYCYLVRNDSTLDPFSVSTQACAWKPCFGPYRTRRQAVGIVEAFFHLTRLGGHCRTPVEKFSDLLAGRDDSLVRALERQAESAPPESDGNSSARIIHRTAATLRNAYARGSILHDAARLLEAILILDGQDGGYTIARFSRAGLHLHLLSRDISSAQRLLHSYRQNTRPGDSGSSGPLPKAIADVLCVAAHYCRLRPDSYGMISPSAIPLNSARGLLGLITGPHSIPPFPDEA